MAEQYTVTIESVDYEGKGIARIEGKTVFVYGALAGEEVLIEIVKRKPSFDKAKLVEVKKFQNPNYVILVLDLKKVKKPKKKRN